MRGNFWMALLVAGAVAACGGSSSNTNTSTTTTTDGGTKTDGGTTTTTDGGTTMTDGGSGGGGSGTDGGSGGGGSGTDGGTTPADGGVNPAPTKCDDLTPPMTVEGECVGSIARWCGGEDDNTIESLDCTNVPLSGGSVSGTCGFFNGFGSWCVLPAGGGCYFPDDQVAFACGTASGQTAGFGCQVGINAAAGALESTCVTTTTTCTVPGPTEEFMPVCSGNNLVANCLPWGQPLFFDCTAMGGTGCSAGACTGMPAGAPCDDLFVCAAGLTCDATAGTCR
jgi:hypothetical protein